MSGGKRGIWTEMTILENLEIGAHIRKDKKGIKKDFEKVYAYFPVLKERKTVSRKLKWR